MTVSDSKCALVTGGGGFIGGCLTRRLLVDGFDVHVIVQPGAETVPEGATAHVHDGSMAGMMKIVEQVRPSVVFHLASVFLPSHTAEQIEPLIISNVLFGTQLLEAMAQVGCTRLVNTGTGWQYFAGAEYDPVNLYAATKQAFEDIARYYTVRGISTITLALYDSYGPNDPRPKVPPLLIRAALSGERLELSPGEQLLHIVYVDDIADAFVAAAGLLVDDTEPSCRRYSVTAQPPVTLRELASAVERATGRVIDTHWGARPYRDREVLDPWIGERLPGWAPRVPIDEGLRRVLEADWPA